MLALATGRRIAWYRVDARRGPYALGAHDNEVGPACGPRAVQSGGIAPPAWVARPDGSWRAWLQRLEVNRPIADKLFDPPRSPIVSR